MNQARKGVTQYNNIRKIFLVIIYLETCSRRIKEFFVRLTWLAPRTLHLECALKIP
jgi:hypothetical protein